MKKRCEYCKEEFGATPLNLFCPICVAKFPEATKAKQAEANRTHKILRGQLCAQAFLDTTIERLPNPAKAREVLDCTFGHPGLVLHGPSGTGKTRCGWLLALREFDLGKSIGVLDSAASFEYRAAYLKGEEYKWFDSKRQFDLLFLDDVFKAKMTDSFEQAMFAIVDYRVSHYLPILVTSNDTGETLAARMSSDRRDAFVRRIRMCREIRFEFPGAS